MPDEVERDAVAPVGVLDRERLADVFSPASATPAAISSPIQWSGTYLVGGQQLDRVRVATRR